MIFVNNYQGALKAKKATLRLQDEEFNQKQRHRRIQRQEVELLIGSMFFTVLIFFVGLGIGTLFGIMGAMNFLPQAVACKSTQSLCYKLRWDKSKVVLSAPVTEPSPNPKQPQVSKSKSK